MHENFYFLRFTFYFKFAIFADGKEKKMIYFVIPLRSKAASRNWEGVTRNFNRTLESCYNQTNPDFHIFVACHDIPTLDQEYDDRVTFLPVTIPTPTNDMEMKFDKRHKMHTCMYAVREELAKLNMGGGYVLPVYADDLVNNQLAAFFSGRDDGKCYTSAKGYIWHCGSRFVTLAKDLWRTCGSCIVVYYKPYELPPTDFELEDAPIIYIFQISHRDLPRYARRVGKTFGTIPFPTTVYVLGTGENHSALTGVGMSWKRTVEGLIRIPRLITKKKKKEFNIRYLDE